jgi:hypothetical protein
MRASGVRVDCVKVAPFERLDMPLELPRGGRDADPLEDRLPRR